MVNFGIIGAGNIAHRFAKALSYEKRACLEAISGRNARKLQAFAEEFPCSKQYLNYEDVLNDDKINAVYIALPHKLHKEWILKALKAHKAVLVEKPGCLNAEEMREVVSVARQEGVLFMEAQKGRFVPCFQDFKRRYEAREFGEIKRIEASFDSKISYFGREMHSYLMDPICGGANLDVGTYIICLFDDFASGELKVNKVEANFLNGVDLYTHLEGTIGNMEFSFETALERQKPRIARFITDEHEIIMDNYYRAESYIVDGIKYEIPYEYDDFYSQIKHFVTLLEEGKIESEIVSFESSTNIAKLLDDLREVAMNNHVNLNYLDSEKMNSDDVLKEEQQLDFKNFNQEDAFKLGCLIKEMATSPLRIRVTLDHDLIFQCLMEGKKQDLYLNMKQKMVEDYSHSTWYVTKKMMEHDQFYLEELKEQRAYPMGGGFPLVVNGEIRGAVLVSGMSDGEDHEMVVRALRKYKEMKENGIS